MIADVEFASYTFAILNDTNYHVADLGSAFQAWLKAQDDSPIHNSGTTLSD